MLRDVLRKTPARKQPQPATLEPAKLPWPEVRPPPRLTPERHAPRKRSEENGRTARRDGSTAGRQDGVPAERPVPCPRRPCSCRDERPKPTSRSRPGNASEDGVPKPHRPRSSVSFVLHPAGLSLTPDCRARPRPYHRPPAPPPLPSPLQLPIGHPAAEAKRNGNPNRTQQIGLTRPRIRPFQTAEKPRPRPHSGDSPRCKELRTEFGIS